MATSVTPPAASSPPMSNYDQIGAALNAPAEPSQAASAETPPEPASETPPETPPATETPEPGEQAQPQAEAAAAEPEVEDNPYEREETDEEFKPQTLQEILRTKDGKRMLAHDKAMRALAKPPNPDGTGGIGFIPTIEQAKEHYGSHRSLTMMEHDLNSGNPQQAERLLVHLFNPQRGEGANTVAAQLIPALAKSNPAALGQVVSQLASLKESNLELYQEASLPFITDYSETLWAKYETIPDPAPVKRADGTFESGWNGSFKQSIYNAAQAAHKALTGAYRPVDDAGKVVPGPDRQNDPLASRTAELDARQAKLDETDQRNRQLASQKWTGEFGKSVATALYSELDKALATLKKMYEATPKKYERARKDFHDLIVADVPKNQQAWDLYQVRVAEARRTGSPELMTAAAKEFVRLAVPVITAKRKQFLEEEGAIVQKLHDDRQSELRSIDSQKAVNGTGGAAPTPGKGPPIQRTPGESASDFNLRQLRS